MVFYHGTTLEKALLIADRGAFLSPLQQSIETYQQEEPQASITEAEDFAKKLCSQIYPAREWSFRVQCISFSLSLEKAYKHLGIVLGIDLTAEQLNNREQGHVIFIPAIVPLETLREVHMQPSIFEKDIDLVRKHFDQYNPQYLQL